MNRTKKEIIRKILEFNPNLIWVLDEEQYYKTINTNQYGDSFWIEDNLYSYTKAELRELESKLNKAARQ